MTDARETAPPHAADLALAHHLADLADRVSSAHFCERDLRIDTKPDRTFVTEADLTVERRIRERLAQERPDDGVLGEEYGAAGDAARQWIVDPIDGTSNYLRGIPVWGTLIALAVEGKPVVGVVSSPALGKRWWATTGGGAWTTDMPGAEPRSIQVSGIAELEHASISFQSIAQWDQAGYLNRLVTLTRRVWRDRAYGDMWSYMLLAEGLLDAVGEFDVKTYDLAALIPIIEEAGGTFTSVTGLPGPSNGSALASNGLLHAALLDVLA